MNLLYTLLGSILCVLLAGVYLLRRILNILRQMNNGEPSAEELRNIDFSQIKPKR